MIAPVSFRVTLSTFHCFRFISFVLKVHFEFLRWRKCADTKILTVTSAKLAEDEDRLSAFQYFSVWWRWKWESWLQNEDGWCWFQYYRVCPPTLLITLNSMKDLSSPTSPAQNLVNRQQCIIEASKTKSVPLKRVSMKNVPLRNVSLRGVPLRIVPLRSVMGISQDPVTVSDISSAIGLVCPRNSFVQIFIPKFSTSWSKCWNDKVITMVGRAWTP